MKASKKFHPMNKAQWVILEISSLSDFMVIHKKKIEFLILWTQLKAYAYGE